MFWRARPLETITDAYKVFPKMLESLMRTAISITMTTEAFLLSSTPIMT